MSDGGFSLDTSTNVGWLLVAGNKADDDASAISDLMAWIFSLRSCTRSLEATGYDILADLNGFVEISLRTCIGFDCRAPALGRKVRFKRAAVYAAL